MRSAFCRCANCGFSEELDPAREIYVCDSCDAKCCSECSENGSGTTIVCLDCDTTPGRRRALAREILRGIADQQELGWLFRIEAFDPNARSIVDRLKTIRGGARGALPRPPPSQLADRCRALLEAIRRARAGGAA